MNTNRCLQQDLRLDDKVAVTIGHQRHGVCLEASFEIESLAMVLLQATQDEEMSEFVVRGLSIRINSLARSIMSGLSDRVVSTTELEIAVGLKPSLRGGLV